MKRITHSSVLTLVLLAVPLVFAVRAQSQTAVSDEGASAVDNLGTHGFAKSGEVRIHYVTKGEGPLVVMIHGFPDFWYTWRAQMPALAEKFQVVESM